MVLDDDVFDIYNFPLQFTHNKNIAAILLL